MESDVVLQLDVRTEHADDRQAWRLLARLEILGSEAPPEDPNEIVGRLQPPSGKPIFFHASDWDPSQSRYEIATSYFFPRAVESGIYVASVPGLDGEEVAVQDTVDSRFLELPTIMHPVYGEFVGCEPLLRWRPVPRAARYQVLLRRRVDHVTVLSDTIPETEMAVPPGVLALDTVYEWKVYAFDRSADGDVDNQSKGKFSRMVVTQPCRGASGM